MNDEEYTLAAKLARAPRRGLPYTPGLPRIQYQQPQNVSKPDLLNPRWFLMKPTNTGYEEAEYWYT